MSAFTTPEWVQHAVFYQIFPDRFASSSRVEKPGNLEAWDAAPTIHGFKGGDLLGIVEKLDYLQDLGITAIYMTPIFQSACNHRYHTHDYTLVDPLLGGNAALRELIDEAHRRNIRIVLDGVFNHASRGFFQFNHILETEGQSPYIDWFTVRSFPLNAYWGNPNYKCWVDLAALPTFNHANPQVRRFIMDIARRWVDFGIDGWRLDVPFEVHEPGFWEEFRQTVKAANPDAYITGEIPWDARPWLQGDMFDGVMNYLMAYSCWGFFGGHALDMELVGHWVSHGPEYFKKDAKGFADNVTGLLNLYPRPAVMAQLNLLDSHDTARFLSMAGGNLSALRLATVFQMTYPGAPCVYYGDEVGLAGGKDPDCRRGFPWNADRQDSDTLALFKKTIALRKAHSALRSGDWTILHASGGELVYLRRDGRDVALVAINNAGSTFHLDLPVNSLLQDGLTLKDGLGTGQAQVLQGHVSGLTLAPFSAAILV